MTASLTAESVKMKYNFCMQAYMYCGPYNAASRVLLALAGQH